VLSDLEKFIDAAAKKLYCKLAGLPVGRRHGPFAQK
jgi:hypothetical protein